MTSALRAAARAYLAELPSAARAAARTLALATYVGAALAAPYLGWALQSLAHRV